MRGINSIYLEKREVQLQNELFFVVGQIYSSAFNAETYKKSS
jgi:hypothetical protein